MFKGGAAGTHHLRSQPLQFGEDGAGAKQEHAAIPGETPGGHKGCGCSTVRFLYKAGDGDRYRLAPWALAHGVQAHGFSRLDVAITGFGGGRHDAEGDQPACRGCRQGRLHHGPKAFRTTDHVVGGQHQQQGVLAARGSFQSGYGHRRCGIAAHRFKQNGCRFNADLPQLLGHDETVVFVTDEEGWGQAGKPFQPLLGLLQQGFVVVAGKSPVLLWVAGAG